MFKLFNKVFKKEKQVKVDVSNLLGNDFEIRVKKMLDEVLSAQKNRLEKNLQEVLPSIKL